ncbi:MAG: efflux RND transporter permease subunit, partial [Bacteroidales bacterium]
MKKSPSILLLYALVSNDSAYDTKFLSNYLNINVVNVLKRIDGVGDVNLFGGDDYAMRIWLNPERMAGLSVSVQDVQAAIKDQNVQAAAGMIGKSPAAKGQEMSIMLRVQGRLTDEKQFGNIIVKANQDGSLVRMDDIARIELGLKTYDANGRFNGKTAPVIAVYQSPGSNAVAVRKLCDETMQQLSKEFPLGITYEKGLDTVEFVTASIEEVLKTLMEAFILVFIVVFIFLQDWRATLIPAITVPVSLIGALAAFSFLGFSINMLTLFALVLAIGIVVDDAIVVLEAVQEKIDSEGLTPLEATKHTMNEITGAILTITMVLCAVFIPVSFLGGTVGVMYKQFALTLISSILISALLALTLTPPLCVILLRPKKDKKGLLGKFFSAFDKGFNKTTNGYVRIVESFTHHLSRPIMFLSIILVLTVVVMKFLPSGFLPSEDQGYFFININTPKAYSLQKTDEVARQVEALLKKLDGVESYTMIPGYSILDNSVSTTNGMCFVKLKSWEERSAKELHVEMIIKKLQAQMSKIPGGICMAFNAPAISGLGKTGGLELQLEDKSGAGLDKMTQVVGAFYQGISQSKALATPFSPFRNDIPQFKLTVDKEKAKTMDVPVNSIYSTLQSLFGSYYVNDFNKFGKSYRVIIQADAIYRANKEDINKVYVRSNVGKMVPLGTLIQITPTQGPDVVKRFNLYSSADFTIGIPPGSSTGQGIEAVKEIAAKTLPYGFGYEYSGMTREEIISGGQAPYIFTLCFIFVYFLLAAKYESWLLPIPVLLAIPFGAFGAFGLQWARGLQNNIYAQIGLIMLIGLVAKNAILIVEFAKQKYDAGHPLLDSAIEGAKLRFRPILMTSFAFILGVVPLMTAAGAGAASRHALGTSVFGGMLMATICGVMVVPSLYVAFQKLENRMKKKSDDAAK